MAIGSNINIGIRHLLPFHPFWFAIAGLGLAQVGARSRTAALALVAAQLVESLVAAPHGFAYFNAIAGGVRGGDGLFINTAGIGVIEHDCVIGPGAVRPGDVVLINGDLGRHGIAIMATREGLEFETAIESDSAPVADAVLALLRGGVEVHCLRDLTRGGLVSAANEIAQAAGVGLHLRETDIPVRDDVRGACELLGFDPLYVANEGRFMAVVAADDAARALDVLRGHPQAPQPAIIGHAHADAPGRVTLESRIGAQRILDMLSGEQLPRIC